MSFGIRKRARIILAALLAVTVAACGARAASDAQAGAGGAQPPAAAQGAEGVSVEGPAGEAAAVLGGEQAARALDREVAAWCAANVEGAASARWDGRIACDFVAGEFGLSYLCDDGPATAVRVVAHPAASRYEISKEAV